MIRRFVGGALAVALFWATLSLFDLTRPLAAQISSSTARHIIPGKALPATCSPNTGDVFFKTTATVGGYQCLTANTWTAIGAGTGGPSGPSGAPGPSGPANGPSGPSGPAGATGAAGAAGADGASGPSGPSGVTGASGPSGATGAAGPSGPSGATGAAGSSGPSGPTGATGAAGPSGPSGPSGPGTVTSATIAGTANQITASGTCTITTSGTCTLSLPTAVEINGTATIGEFLVASTATTTPRGITSGQWSNTTDSARFAGYKARGTQASPTVITTGDIITRYSGWGYDGSNYIETASVVFTSEGTIASTRMPSNITFMTGTDAAPTVMTTALTLDSAQKATFAGRVIGTVNGALSAPGLTFTGTWVTGGTATTTKPYVLIEPAGATSNAWSTSGTGLGINTASGFTGNLLDLQLNGAARLNVNSTGSLTAANGLQTTSGALLVGTWIRGDNTALALANNIPIQMSSTNAQSGTKDTGLARNAAGVVEVNNGTAGTMRDLTLRHYLGSGTAPTIASGFGSSPSIAGSDAAGRVTVGTGGVATTGAITFGTAWATAPACVANNETTQLVAFATATTTTLTIASATPFGAADKLVWNCIGY